jgi:hypothetical protein
MELFSSFLIDLQSFCLFVFVLLFVGLEFELRASHLQSKQSTA